MTPGRMSNRSEPLYLVEAGGIEFREDLRGPRSHSAFSSLGSEKASLATPKIFQRNPWSYPIAHWAIGFPPAIRLRRKPPGPDPFDTPP